MKVLFVNRMAAMERGGGETFDLEISRHLEKLGCEIGYLFGAPLLAAPASPIAHSDAHLLRTPYLPWFPWDKVKAGWRVRVAEFRCFERKACRWILKYGNRYDLIQICELPHLVHLLKAKHFDRTVVMRVTAPNVYDPEGGLAEADAVIASGTSIEKLRNGSRPDCHDVPNAVDHQAFSPGPSEWRQRMSIPNDAPVILYVARFQDFKNHELLIEAFSMVVRNCPEARLVLVGSGPLRQRSEAEAARMGLARRVIFLGEVPHAELPSIYRAATVKAISSDYESFCFAALEAMSTGLPVVTTDCGWVPRLLGAGGADPSTREGGLVVPVRDPALLAQALARVISERALADTMGAWNRERVLDKHRWDSSAQKLQDIYRSLLSTPQHAAT